MASIDANSYQRRPLYIFIACSGFITGLKLEHTRKSYVQEQNISIKDCFNPYKNIV